MVTSSDKNVSKTITIDEAELYDRQIRLWGVDAQKMINSAKILIVGMGGVGAEAAKNIILAGVKSVKLLDSEVVSSIDYACQFLIEQDAVGKNRAESSLKRAQELNHMVEVTADGSCLDSKSDDFFYDFTVIIATNVTRSEIIRLNRIAREKDIKFFAADCFGIFGYMFLDLGEHHYKTERRFGNDINQVPTVVDGVARYITFQDVISLDWNLDELKDAVKKFRPELFVLFVLLEFVEKNKRKPDPLRMDEDYDELIKLRDEFAEKNGMSIERLPNTLFNILFGELGPAAAITGGVIAQEVVKAVSHKDPPIVNVFLCNPMSYTGYVENLVE